MQGYELILLPEAQDNLHLLESDHSQVKKLSCAKNTGVHGNKSKTPQFAYTQIHL